MLAVLLMIANYFHDLAVALLASNIAVVWFLGRLLDRIGRRDELMPTVFRKLSIVTFVAFAFVIVGGGLRAWFFMEYEWNPAVGKGQVAALVVKHIVLVTVTLFGLLAHLKYQRIYGRNDT